MIKHIFFDLDGTVVDSAESISWTFMQVGNDLTGKNITQEEIIPILGGFRLYVFQDLYGLEGEELKEAQRRYGELLQEAGLKREKLFPGMVALLEDLQQRGYALHINSARPATGSMRSLELHQLTGYFTHVIGPDSRYHESKGQVFGCNMRDLGIDPKEALMVGDMVTDIEAAKVCGVPSIALTFGFGKKEDMEGTGADYLAHSVPELVTVLNRVLAEEE